MGPIKHAEVDLQPLTIFIGGNNTGKTYVAYALYGCFSEGLFKVRPKKRKYPVIYEFSDSEIDQLFIKKQLDIKLDVIDKIKSNASYYEGIINSKSVWRNIKSNLQKFSKRFWRFIGSDVKEYFDEFSIDVRLGKEEGKINNEVLEKLFNISIKTVTPYILGGSYIVLVISNKRRRAKTLHIKFIFRERLKREEREQLIEKDKVKNELNTILNNILFDVIFDVIFPKNAYIFPTQRNTLMLDAIKRAIDRSSRKIVFEDKKTNLVIMQFSEEYAYSRPLMDFLEMRDKTEVASIFKERGELFRLATEIEKDLLGGEVMLEKRKEAGATIKFKLNENTKLNLITSSSMVQQLSAIILYLKYLAEPGDLLIIDEPESNLHPEAQFKFVEIIAKMVNSGLWVIISTHTPYIVDHINNLLVAHRIKEKLEQKQIKKELPVPQECMLNPKFVSAYLFREDGTVESIIKDDLIDWESFGKITEQVQRIYSQLIELEEEIKENIK